MLIGICERARPFIQRCASRVPVSRRQTPLDILASRSLARARRGPRTGHMRKPDLSPSHRAHRAQGTGFPTHYSGATDRLHEYRQRRAAQPPRQGGCAHIYMYRATLSTVISKVHESATSLRRGGGGLRRWCPSRRPAASRSPWLRLGLGGRGRGRGRSRSRVRGKGRARGRLA